MRAYNKGDNVKISKALAGIALAGTAIMAGAQSVSDFPSRPIRMIIPYPAGGPVDAAGRLLAKGMAEVLKQPVVIDNKPGAGSTLGTAEVVRAVPDGYTVLFTLPDSFTYVPQLFKKLPYDPVKDLAPVSQVALTPAVLVMRTDTGVTSLRQMHAGEKSMAFGTWGPGTYPQLIGAALARQTGADLTIVPYRGGAPALQDFMGGQIQMTMAGIAQAQDMQQKGTATIVAIAGTKRSPIIPNVPTFAEQGMTDPAFSIPIWVGMAAPARTPAPVVSKLRDAAVVALRAPDMQKFLTSFGWSAVGGTPAEFRAAIDAEAPVVARAMRAAGVEPE
jgi:tripartite-type tricarboxylate transporter receptor subunit TctC